MNSDFVARLRSERERVGLTPLDTSVLGGVSREMWNRYERGAAMPNAEVLLKLQGHGFDVNFILGGVRMLTDTTLSDEERQLMHCYRSTDDEGRAAVLRSANMEARRMEMLHAGGYVAVSPAKALLLHEPPPGPKKRGA